MKKELLVMPMIVLLSALSGCSSQNVKINVGETLDFNKSIKCSYQYGQYLSEESGLKQHDLARENVKNSSIMIWNFMDINTDKPKYLSDGDSGTVVVIPHPVTKDGLSIYLPQGNGAHLFSVWNDGTSFWSKHNNILNARASAQWVGTCSN